MSSGNDNDEYDPQIEKWLIIFAVIITIALLVTNCD